MRLTNLREGDEIMTETLPIIHVVSDSWMILRKTERVEPNALMKSIDITPHKVAVSVKTAERLVPTYGIVQNCHYREFVKKSLTYDIAAANADEIEKWARNVPKVTITHLGSVDVTTPALANLENNKLRKEYPNMVCKFLENWEQSARSLFENKPQSLRAFERKMEKHRWLIIGVSDWGKSDRIRGISWQEHRHNRRLANTGMDSYVKKFFQNHRAVIYKPMVNNPEYYNGGIHLTGKSQEEFLEQVFGVAARLACDFCHEWSTDNFDKEEHVQLKEQFNICKGAHIPLLNPQY